MPAAVLTSTSLSATITQATLTAFLKTALGNLGTLFDEYSSGGTNSLVFARAYNGLAYGTAYIRLSVTTAMAIQYGSFAAWNAVAHTGTGGVHTNTTVIMPTAGSQLDCLAVQHPEFSSLMFSQGATRANFAILRPTTRPAYWDEAIHAAWVSSIGINIGNMMLAVPNPLAVSNISTFVVAPGLETANPALAKREVVPGIGLNGAAGMVGTFGPDFVSVAGSGLALLDILQVSPGVEEYLLLKTVSPYLAIRST